VQSVCVLTSVRVGNHALSSAEQAAGLPPREPFVDDDGAPIDPDQVSLWLVAATGAQRAFSWPTPGPDDDGTLTQESPGRFYVDWTPDDDEDGLWRWFLVGAMTLGTAQSDQDVFYVRRPIAGLPVVAPAAAVAA
jgi:hypothetical protein